MRPRPRIYLDTSVINFLFADDAPEKKDVTVRLFEDFIKTGFYHTFISEFVLDEIEETSNEVKRNKLKSVIRQYPIELIELDKKDEIHQLAKAYIEKGVIPKNKLYDALHIAVTTIERFDFLLSWNFKHMANVNREFRVIATNLELGYLSNIRIVSPYNFIDDGN